MSGGTTTLQVAVGGSIGITHDIETQVGQDLAQRGEHRGPDYLILLRLAFASVEAASLPLAIGVLAIFGSFAELFVVSQATDVSIFAINLATALGLWCPRSWQWRGRPTGGLCRRQAG